MNRSITKPRQLALRAFSALALTLAAAGAWAQDTTSTAIRHGEPSITTDARNASVVYVEGNNLVLKLENGNALLRTRPKLSTPRRRRRSRSFVRVAQACYNNETGLGIVVDSDGGNHTQG